jgi:hypothetical protein
MKDHNMDHEFAEKTGAADRYLLNEVTSEERAEFEEHFFDCAICSDRVRKGSIFIDTAKEVMRADTANPAAANRRAIPKQAAWFAWFKPMTLVPGLAALVLAAIAGYQNLVTLPALRKPQLLSTAVIAPLAREETPVINIDRRLPRFNLNFAVDSSRVYANYICQFKNENGAEILTLESGPREVSAFTLSFLLLASQFPAGRYELTIRPQSDSTVVVQRYTFVIGNGDAR